MSDIVVEAREVWKKFRKGERLDSLRDLIPTAVRRLAGREPPDEAGDMEFWALRDVSFALRRGEALAIIGANGSGKSTMLKLLSGILRPTRGSVRVRGRLGALIEVGAGFHPDLTGRENIYLSGAILGMPKDEVRRKFDAIVAFAELEEFLDTPVKRYSSGMFARLGFAVAAHVDPEILLVDEVLSVGDMRFQQKCLARMRAVTAEGATVIFVSHNLESVQALCPEAILFERGEAVARGATEHVIRRYVEGAGQPEPAADGSVRIDGVVLRDAHGVPTAQLEPGDRAELHLTLQGSRDLRECLLGFFIHRAPDGLAICDYNLPLDSLARGPAQGGEAARLAVQFDANLLRGTYILGLHVYDYSRAQFLWRANSLVTFSVDERCSYAGVAHLRPTLAVLETV